MPRALALKASNVALLVAVLILPTSYVVAQPPIIFVMVGGQGGTPIGGTGSRYTPTSEPLEVGIALGGEGVIEGDPASLVEGGTLNVTFIVYNPSESRRRVSITLEIPSPLFGEELAWLDVPPQGGANRSFAIKAPEKIEDRRNLTIIIEVVEYAKGKLGEKTLDIVLMRDARFSVEKQVSPGIVAPGGQVGVFTAISNAGDVTVRNVTLKESLAQGFSVVEEGSAPEGAFSSGAKIEELAPGSGLQFSYVMACPQAISGNFSASETQITGFGAKESELAFDFPVNVSVVSPDLKLELVPSRPSLSWGKSTEVMLRASNLGNGPASNLTINISGQKCDIDILSHSGMELEGTSPGGAMLSRDELIPGESISVLMVARVGPNLWKKQIWLKVEGSFSGIAGEPYETSDGVNLTAGLGLLEVIATASGVGVGFLMLVLRRWRKSHRRRRILRKKGSERSKVKEEGNGP